MTVGGSFQESYGNVVVDGFCYELELLTVYAISGLGLIRPMTCA